MVRNKLMVQITKLKNEIKNKQNIYIYLYLYLFLVHLNLRYGIFYVKSLT